MKYIVDNKHREFFAENGWIEFDELLPSAKVSELHKAVMSVLAQRIGVDEERLNRYCADDLYAAGRDVWRDSEFIKNIVCNRSLAEIAANLLEIKPVRLAFDQVIVTGAAGRSKDLLLPRGTRALSSFSCIQGLLCGLLIALTEIPKFEVAEPQSPWLATAHLPQHSGAGVFLSPKTPIDFDEILSGDVGDYLLITYTHAVSVVTFNRDDTYTNSLKELGYSFGDRLSDDLHPIVFR